MLKKDLEPTMAVQMVLVLTFGLLTSTAPVRAQQIINNSGSQYPQNAIYVDRRIGTLDKKCWTGGMTQPCYTIQLALEGARVFNSTVVVIEREQCSDDSTTTATCPTWFYYNR